MKKYILIFGLYFATTSISFSQVEQNTTKAPIEITKEFREVSNHLFNAMGLHKDHASMIRGILNRVTMHNPEIPDKFLEELKSSFDEKIFYEELCKLYAEIFTADEMKELLKFYQTPLYRKLQRNSTGFMVKTGEIQENLYIKVLDGMAEVFKQKGYKVPAFMLPAEEPIKEDPIPEQNN